MGAPGTGERHSDEKQSYGPMWADVYDLWGWIEREYGGKLRLDIMLTVSVNNRQGLRCVFRSEDSNAIMGSCGFGRAYTSTARTLPAGLIVALYDVQHSIEKRLSRGLPWDHPELFPPKA